jgi:hypothetical protein
MRYLCDPAKLANTWLFTDWAACCIWCASFFSHPSEFTFDTPPAQISSCLLPFPRDGEENVWTHLWARSSRAGAPVSISAAALKAV